MCFQLLASLANTDVPSTPVPSKMKLFGHGRPTRPEGKFLPRPDIRPVFSEYLKDFTKVAVKNTVPTAEKRIERLREEGNVSQPEAAQEG